jgi:hypothetical protein
LAAFCNSGGKVEDFGDFELAVSTPGAASVGYQKFRKVPILPDAEYEKDVDLAFSFMHDILEPHFKMLGQPRIWSVQQVLDYLDLSKSPGYPWCNFGCSTKADALQHPKFSELMDIMSNSMDVELPRSITRVSGVEQVQICLDKGIYVPIAAFIQKVEILKKKKLYEDQQRAVIASDFLHVLFTDVYDGDFNQKLVQIGRTNSTPIALGQNFHSGGWDRMVRRLSRFPNGFEADASEHESTLWAWWTEKVYDLRCSFMNLSPRHRKRYWFVSVFKSIGLYVTASIVHKEAKEAAALVGWFCGVQKSGQASTLPDNTLVTPCRIYSGIVNLFRLRYGYRPTLSWVQSMIEDVAMGDDLNLTHADEFPFSFIDVLARVWVLTGVLINTPVSYPRPAHELEFCSQHSVVKNGRYVPLLKTGKMTASIARGTERSNLLSAFERLTSLRRVLVSDDKLFDLVTAMCYYLYNKYDDGMCGVREWDDAVLQMRLPRSALLEFA